MGMLPARNYESEHTRFIREMKEKEPALETEPIPELAEAVKDC